MSIRSKICAVTPFVCIIAFTLIGFYTKQWALAWLVFLLIPLMPYFVGISKISITYPFLVLLIYILIGVITKKWHPYWVIFLTIPVYYIFKTPDFHKRNNKKSHSNVIDNE